MTIANVSYVGEHQRSSMDKHSHPKEGAILLDSLRWMSGQWPGIGTPKDERRRSRNTDTNVSDGLRFDEHASLFHERDIHNATFMEASPGRDFGAAAELIPGGIALDQQRFRAGLVLIPGGFLVCLFVVIGCGVYAPVGDDFTRGARPRRSRSCRNTRSS